MAGRFQALSNTRQGWGGSSQVGGGVDRDDCFLVVASSSSQERKCCFSCFLEFSCMTLGQKKQESRFPPNMHTSTAVCLHRNNNDKFEQNDSRGMVGSSCQTPLYFDSGSVAPLESTKKTIVNGAMISNVSRNSPV